METETILIEKPIEFSYNVNIDESGMENNDFIIAGVAINATTTSNNHKFLPQVLRDSARTLVGVPLLVDHENKVENIKGRVVYANYDETNERIPFRAKVMDEAIRGMIKDGRLNSVSVGACVNPRDIEEDSDGTLVPRNITFKELSLVAVPADSRATFNIALKEAYSLIKKPEIKEVIKEVNDQPHERRVKMSENEEVKEVKDTTEEKENSELTAMRTKLDTMAKELEAEKANVKVVEKEVIKEVIKEEVKEEVKYNILQGNGSLKGSSFTYIANKY